MLAIQVTAKKPGCGPPPTLPWRSVVKRLARLRPIASSLMAAAPPQRSMSQLDCQPPRLECWVLGWDFSRCSITPRSSALSAAASGRSTMTSGVANKGMISGAAGSRAGAVGDMSASAIHGMEDRAGIADDQHELKVQRTYSANEAPETAALLAQSAAWLRSAVPV